VRIATWNLERGGRTRAARRAQEVTLRELERDVIVLTEPGPEFEAAAGTVTSPRLRENRSVAESWIAILGNAVRPASLEIPFERMAAAAVAETLTGAFVIYGSVLPWGTFRQHAPELARQGESSLDSFVRVLGEQLADIEELRRRHPGHAVIWAGDFNQHVHGPDRGGSRAKREALEAALVRLGLVAWNGAAAHAQPGMHAIDLICGPREIEIRAQGRIDPTRDGVRMTDHAGYWVDF
jgi:endonuclease/exonuclease/phosphatase family metal-dependent hydrolase